MKIKIFYSIIIGLFLAQLYSLFWQPKPPAMHLKRVSFAQLPGWNQVNGKQSLQAFQISCKAFIKQNPNQIVGSEFISLTASDWHPACRAAQQVDSNSKAQIQAFFETWFLPVEFVERHPVKGLFTGYYMPLLHGSLTKTEHFTVPIYGLPSTMLTIPLREFSADFARRKLVGHVVGQQVKPFYTRAEIDKGAISPFTPVIAWVSSHLDRLSLEIEGSGIVKLTDGNQMAVGYAGENGAPYTSIAQILIDRGIMTHDTASMQRIRKYFDTHPQETKRILNKNKSFVFFHQLTNRLAVGSQGVPLTAGYSLAVDRKWIPMGTPLWLVTRHPVQQSQHQKSFRRLMIAQDTGGAIKGAVRGDVYWGEGEKATELAGRMKNPGHYWLLLPRHIVLKNIA